MGGLGEPEDHFLNFHGRLFKFQNLIIIMIIIIITECQCDNKKILI